MKILYHSKKTEKLCCDYKMMVKSLGSNTANKLSDLMTLMEAAENLFDISTFPQYRLHGLTGNRKCQYSIVISKGTKWRLIVYPLDENERLLINKGNERSLLVRAIKVEVIEVSEHYA